MTSYIYFCFIWLVAGLLTGLTSFGGNLFGVPFSSFIYSPRDSIVAGCIIGTTISLALSLIYIKSVVWKDTLLLAVCALIGAPLGVYFLEIAGDKLLLLAAAFGILILLGWEALSKFIKIKETAISRIWAIPGGLISGVMMSALSMGGPPLVIYLFFRNLNKKELISTVNMAATLMLAVILPIQYFSGLFSKNSFSLGAMGSVASILGILISIPILKLINLKIFRLMVIIMLVISAIILLARAI